MAASVLLVPVPAVAMVATSLVPAVEEISVGIQGMSVVAQHSSGGKKARVPKTKAAGGKAPKQTRASKPGMSLSLGGVELSGGVSGPVDVPVVEDSFLVRLPGGEEYVIPGRYVRPAADATREILESYASLINVQSNDLVLWGEDLTSVFEAINYEFSVFGFHDRVLADAKDFVMPEEVRTRDTVAYVAQGRSLEALVRSRRAERGPDRFNLTRCDAVFANSPEYTRLASLA